MSGAICTLFEGDYHFGVGALANSAYRNGWRGVLYAGYRGALPPWAKGLRDAAVGSKLDFAPGGTIHFIPLSTTAHLTNYKPDFLLDVWNTLASEAESLFYFDPDIVLHCAWEFLEEWASYGVALCEDVNSPLSFNHPRRAGWKRYFAPHGLALRDVTEIYVNGGFAGLRRANKNFLRTWMEAQKFMAQDFGGLERAAIEGAERLDARCLAPTYMFNRTDQDALNVAVMASGCEPSIVGSEGMDFKAGGYVMSHALGGHKPWRGGYLRNIARGIRPRLVDQYYWSAADTPIRVHSNWRIAAAKFALKLGGALGRFYAKA